MQKELELYEMLYLVDPGITESELNSKISFYSDFLTNLGSQVMIQNRGKRSLSYKIRGCETANYIQMIYVGNQKLRLILDTTIGRDRSVLRYLTTKIPKLPEVL
jgi:small subunit ribosomal protein S6|mmetsp:Transcript_3178/g.10723  ORF Transcript_3178/g.10723 Transcript_3178/m.10723 type:complete len:104 (+) Transcript_3178:33-344(+)